MFDTMIHNDLLEIKVLTVNKMTEIMKVFFVVSLYCIIQSKVTDNFHCLEYYYFQNYA